jgi:hypothetical protein
MIDFDLIVLLCLVFSSFLHHLLPLPRDDQNRLSLKVNVLWDVQKQSRHVNEKGGKKYFCGRLFSSVM